MDIFGKFKGVFARPGQRIEPTLRAGPSAPTARSFSADPAQRVVAEGLSYPARITHDSLDGEVKTFEVTIEKVFYRERVDGAEELAFRGAASIGNWRGFKTFFANRCTAAFDAREERDVADISTWILAIGEGR